MKALSHHTIKMMLSKELHKWLINCTTRNVARDFKNHSLRNALLITVTRDREMPLIWRLDESDVGSQTIRLQAILARISCDDVLECVTEEVLKEVGR